MSSVVVSTTPSVKSENNDVALIITPSESEYANGHVNVGQNLYTCLRTRKEKVNNLLSDPAKISKAKGRKALEVMSQRKVAGKPGVREATFISKEKTENQVPIIIIEGELKLSPEETIALFMDRKKRMESNPEIELYDKAASLKPTPEGVTKCYYDYMITSANSGEIGLEKIDVVEAVYKIGERELASISAFFNKFPPSKQYRRAEIYLNDLTVLPSTEYANGCHFRFVTSYRIAELADSFALDTEIFTLIERLNKLFDL